MNKWSHTTLPAVLSGLVCASLAKPLEYVHDYQ